MTMSGYARDFERDGVVLVPDVLDATARDRLGDELARSGTPGLRDLLRHERFSTLARTLRMHTALAALVPADHVAVQGIRFEKSVDTNWLVAWHQDLGIPVRERVEDGALSGWSIKEGATYVQPPVEVLEQLVVVRVHVDACTDIDGPLRVVPGSHCRGRLDADQAREVREQLGERACVAPRGSALVMRPLLLHASSKALGTSLRRVLHLVYGPASLPSGLAWHHAA